MIARAWRDESGIALIMALVTLFVLSLTLVTVLDFSAANARSARFSASDQRAVSLAESGFNDAAAILMSASDPSLSSALPSTPTGTAPREGGTVVYSGTKSGNLWTITATSSVPNPTGGSPLTHTVSGQVQVTPSDPLSSNLAWNYVFSDTTTSCMQIQNSYSLAAPLYVRGNLCMSGNNTFTGALLDVRGSVQVRNPSNIGSAGSPIPKVRVANGCRAGTSGSFVTPCGTAQRVYTSSFEAVPPDISKPPIDIARWYEEAKPGPKHYCTSGTFPGGSSKFDPDNGTAQDWDAGTINLTGSNYSCAVYSGVVLKGLIAYNSGTLSIFGTIFFDGDISLGGNQDILYTGRGVIYARNVTIRNHTTLCGVTSCNQTTWDPATNLLLLVAGGAGATAYSLENNTRFQGAIYAVGGSSLQNSSEHQGPIITDSVSVQNNGNLYSWPPLTDLLIGMPQFTPAPPSAAYIPGSWRG